MRLGREKEIGMNGLEQRLRERHAAVQTQLDVIEQTAAGREGDQQGIFTEEETASYNAGVKTLRGIAEQLRQLQTRSENDIADYLTRKGVSAPGQVADQFRDGASIVSQEKGVFKTLGAQLRAIKASCAAGASVDERLGKVMGAVSGGSANVGADGGWMIESQFMPGIMERAEQTGVLWNRCDNIPIGEGFDRVTYKEMDDYDQSAGTVMGGIQVYWASEAATVDAKKFTMSDGEIKLAKLMGKSFMTDEQIEDAPATEAILRNGFGRAIGKKLDRAIFNGTGVGQPLGFMNSGALITVSKEAGQANDTLVAENFINMWARMPADLRASSVWLVCVEAETQMPQMQIGTGASGQLIYMPPGGLSVSPFGSIYGRPVIPFAGCKKLGDLGDVVFAALGENYVTITKGAIRTDVSMHVRFEYGEQTFRFTMRCNGAPMWKKAITPENANTGFKQSAFITLAAR